MKKFSFEFYLFSDTALSVANEMVEELGLSIKDVAVVADLIEELLVKLQPNGAKSKAASSGAKSSSTISFDGLHLWDDSVAADVNYRHSTNLEEIKAQESFISNELLSSPDHHR